MSRHYARISDEVSLFFGWDNPLQSYWAYTEKEDTSEDEVILFDIHGVFKKITDINIFKECLRVELEKINISFELSKDQETNIIRDRAYSK